MHRISRTLLAGALLMGISACQQPGTILIPSDDPEINHLRFTDVKDASANTNDFKAELVNAVMAPAPGQDFLTINVLPALNSSTRAFTVTLRTKPDQIKTGSSFPMSLNPGQGACTAVYQESASIVVNQAFQASSGTLVIDKISGTTTLRIEFHIKDAKMEPANTSNGVLSKGSFTLNMHGSPTQ